MFPKSSLDVKSQGQVENKTSDKDIVRVVFRDREDAGGGRETWVFKFSFPDRRSLNKKRKKQSLKKYSSGAAFVTDVV